MFFAQVQVERKQADEEELSKVLEYGSQAAIISCLSLHWVNDLPGQIPFTHTILSGYERQHDLDLQAR